MGVANDFSNDKTVQDNAQRFTHSDLEAHSDDDVLLGKNDLLSLEHVDPVLNLKMHLVNNAIDEIGFTWY